METLSGCACFAHCLPNCASRRVVELGQLLPSPWSSSSSTTLSLTFTMLLSIISSTSVLQLSQKANNCIRAYLLDVGLVIVVVQAPLSRKSIDFSPRHRSLFMNFYCSLQSTSKCHTLYISQGTYTCFLLCLFLSFTNISASILFNFQFLHTG